MTRRRAILLEYLVRGLALLLLIPALYAAYIVTLSAR